MTVRSHAAEQAEHYGLIARSYIRAAIEGIRVQGIMAPTYETAERQAIRYTTMAAHVGRMALLER